MPRPPPPTSTPRRWRRREWPPSSALPTGRLSWPRCWPRCSRQQWCSTASTAKRPSHSACGSWRRGRCGCWTCKTCTPCALSGSAWQRRGRPQRRCWPAGRMPPRPTACVSWPPSTGGPVRWHGGLAAAKYCIQLCSVTWPCSQQGGQCSAVHQPPAKLPHLTTRLPPTPSACLPAGRTSPSSAPRQRCSF